ncbi:MAG: hypothetical protein V2I66_10735 [Halieaceae bacterium]|jgi:hypothetical protein|nr:hypothetical protein [Halieaceae bacterium]
MKYVILPVLLAFVLPCAASQEIALDTLGSLDIEFSTVVGADTLPGHALRGEVRPRAGEAFSVVAPMAASRVQYLRASGDKVAEGDPVVWLEGPEVEHWLSEYRALVARLAVARQRYERNRNLFEEGVLAGEQWADIQARYFALQLEHEHMQHFRDLLLEDDAPHGGVYVATPRAGTVTFDARLRRINPEQSLFSVIAPDSLRLHVEVPAGRAADLAALTLPGCRLQIARVDRVARGFFVSAWSEPLHEGCPQGPGVLVSAVPLYTASSLVVPRAALFQWQGEPTVLVRRGDWLQPHRVLLIADTPAGYAIAQDAALAGREVLSRSVSAVQGILLGLGGD